MRGLRYVLITFLALLVVACAARQEKPVRPDNLSFKPLTFQVPQIEPLLLPNGIRLYLHEDPELPLVEITAMLGAGSISDPVELDGRGSLFAGLLQDGGAGDRNPQAFESYLEELAIDFSVATSTYMTTIDMSMLQEDLDKGLTLLDDVLRRPRFDAERLELLRKQQLEQIRRRDDHPGSIAGRALKRAIYADHVLGREASVASVKLIERDDLVRFHRRHFAPENLWLAISGDFDAAEMRSRIEALFGDWQQSDKLPQPISTLRPGLEPGFWVADKDVPQTTILLGHLGISKDSPDLYAVRVMNYILGGGGFNSRLLREIRSNRGLAYSTYSYFQIGRRLPGPYIAGAETKCESTTEVLRLMLAEIERIRTEPVSDAELSLAKESIINSFVFAFTDSHDVLTQQVRLDYFDYPDGYLKQYRDRVAALTKEDIQRAAQTYLKPEQLSIVLVGGSSLFAADLKNFGLPIRKIDPAADGIKE